MQGERDGLGLGLKAGLGSMRDVCKMSDDSIADFMKR